MFRPIGRPDPTQLRTERSSTGDDSADSARRRGASTRRSVLRGLAAVTAGSFLTTSATAQPDTEDVPVPDVEGPISGQPQTGAVHDLESRDYVEEEYFLTGEARALLSDAPPAEYETRMLVYRPAHRRDFNGTALVDWPNVTLQRDVPVTWINTFEYAMREGYMVAIPSVQKVGVDDSEEDQDLVTAHPERYGDLHHPGDAYAFDIFSQAVNVLTARPRQQPPGHASGGKARGKGPRGKGNSPAWRGADPAGGFTVQRTLATGMSQSAFFLRLYINQVQERHGVVDGFLPVAISTIAQGVRDDLVPVMWLNTEDESDIPPVPDSGEFRLWEVAGASHVNVWLSRWAEAMDARDFGVPGRPWDPEAAGQYGQRADAVYGVCGTNYFPIRYAYRAALDHLNDWVRRNETPPSAPRIEREVHGDDTIEIQTDEFGNALGGLRLPPIDVPVATYDARSCGLLGQTRRLDDETLADLYPTREDYLAAIQAAADEAVDAGHLLPADADDLLARAEHADLGGD